MPRLLVEIAKDCHQIVIRAVKDLGSDLQGMSIIDLCMDNLTDEYLTTSDVKSALVIAGVDSIVSIRLRRSYSLKDDRS